MGHGGALGMLALASRDVLKAALAIDLLREEHLVSLLIRMFWVSLVDIWPHDLVLGQVT